MVFQGPSGGVCDPEGLGPGSAASYPSLCRLLHPSETQVWVVSSVLFIHSVRSPENLLCQVLLWAPGPCGCMGSIMSDSL